MKTEMKQVKKIGVLSLAKIFAVVGIITGFLFGIMVTIQASSTSLSFSEAVSYIKQDPTQIVSVFFLVLGYWSLIVAPLLFGVFQFVYGAIIALIYNLIARYVGGIKVELD